MDSVSQLSHLSTWAVQQRRGLALAPVRSIPDLQRLGKTVPLFLAYLAFTHDPKSAPPKDPVISDCQLFPVSLAPPSTTRRAVCPASLQAADKTGALKCGMVQEEFRRKTTGEGFDCEPFNAMQKNLLQSWRAAAALECYLCRWYCLST